MKKYYSIAWIICSAFSFAQQTISFENNEGFNTGNINGQAGWISTPTGGQPENVGNQMISADKASDGSRSLKIVKEPTYGTQPDPIIGGFYNLPTPLAYNNFSVSFDINMSQVSGSVFGFQGVNNTNDAIVARIDFDKTGVIKIMNMVSGILDLVSMPEIWSPNIWYRFKVVGTASDIRYYLNNTLIYTGSAASTLNIDQLRFVHNNTLGSAYIDNIKINTELVMGVKDSQETHKILSLYPNPATDFIYINSLDKIKGVEIYDASGKQMKTEMNDNKINVKGFLPGFYLINIQTERKKITEKVIIK
ncbi:T9SS type A sorting domain-containing protein [Chryseobacterium sp. Tr-659]|uniref:T9SS type A sorting domain-containing protein n=1 Tax=Chryseobacterium sp. Tr-659 TaxID=2608340 RepID=UPI00142187C2|nr:T9SS type A sorting domain-containing protein [Chryseobacterium sp. Tr-659]NIF04998.1 T9SS type A sorting domain-containing protein [Chryseobacterium sp. Tr-659]